MPHSRKMLQDGVVDFTPRRFRKTFRIHFCNNLSISAPCRKYGVAHIWLAYNRGPLDCTLFCCT
eukprot:1161691-Pelagomonas_calceolata.AAC.7